MWGDCGENKTIVSRSWCSSPDSCQVSALTSRLCSRFMSILTAISRVLNASLHFLSGEPFSPLIWTPDRYLLLSVSCNPNSVCILYHRWQLVKISIKDSFLSSFLHSTDKHFKGHWVQKLSSRSTIPTYARHWCWLTPWMFGLLPLWRGRLAAKAPILTPIDKRNYPLQRYLLICWRSLHPFILPQLIDILQDPSLLILSLERYSRFSALPDFLVPSHRTS